jgi:hypothetical protein
MASAFGPLMGKLNRRLSPTTAGLIIAHGKFATEGGYWNFHQPGSYSALFGDRRLTAGEYGIHILILISRIGAAARRGSPSELGPLPPPGYPGSVHSRSPAGSAVASNRADGEKAALTPGSTFTAPAARRLTTRTA